MKKATTHSRARTTSPPSVRSRKAGRQQDRPTTTSSNPPLRTPAHPGPTILALAPRVHVDRASHPEDAARDDRLARTLAANAGRTAIARHRERITATENEEDGVPEDEDALEEAAMAEIDAGADDVR